MGRFPTVGRMQTFHCFRIGIVSSALAVFTSWGNPSDDFQFSEEIQVRQELLQVSLGKLPADLIIQGATVLDVFNLFSTKRLWGDLRDFLPAVRLQSVRFSVGGILGCYQPDWDNSILHTQKAIGSGT